MTDETPDSGRHSRGSDGDERTVRTPRSGDSESAPTSGSTSGPTSGSADTGSHDSATGHDVPSPFGGSEETGGQGVVGHPSGAGDEGADPDDPTEAEGAARGRVRYQDPESTTPREPTVAEQRARREAEKRREAQEAASAAAEERQRKNRKRMLIGGGVVVGLVAVIAIGYAASSDDEVTAQCTDQSGKVVPDENCTNAQQRGGYYDTGGHFVPLFIPFGGFGGNQYHYNYGSNSPVGTVAQGGSTAPPPSGTTLRGSSGSSVGSSGSNGTVSRGGLGVGGSGSKGGSSGSSGGSSGS